MAEPTFMLQGPSVSGSAAAPVTEVPKPVPTAPAMSIPRPSSARRCKRPLPATTPGSGDPDFDRLTDIVASRPGERDFTRQLCTPVFQLEMVAVGQWREQMESAGS